MGAPDAAGEPSGASRARTLRAPRAAAGRVLRNGGRLLRDLVAAPLARRVPREWVVFRMERGLADVPTTPRWLDTLRGAPRPLSAVLEALERIRDDPRVQGVLLRVGSAPLGWSRTSSLVRALAAVRESGKRVVVYAESTGNAGAWLGAAADRFWMAPEGRLDLLGVRADSPYLRQAFDRLGIRPEVLHAGRYKSAGEMLDRASMSEPSRRALGAVMDELYGALVGGLAAGPAGDADAARRWIDEGPYLAAEAREIGLVEELIYADELPQRLAALTPGEALPPRSDGEEGGERDAKLIPEAAYLRVSQRRFQFEPLREARPCIAIVPLLGLIRLTDGSARAFIRALRRLADADHVGAVVVRINSPGGDPLASDLIWRAVCRLREFKPVVASLGDTAASGGYYVAVAANEIVAEPTTLTGSIGVVLAALDFEELLEGLGVRFDGVARGRHAGIYQPYRRRTDEERALLRRQVERLYRDFVQKAAAGRGLEEAELERVAEGRVWTGTMALRHGLVDALGGLDVALDRARALAGLAPGVGVPVHVTPQIPLLERLRGGEPLSLSQGMLNRAQFLCPIRVPLR